MKVEITQFKPCPFCDKSPNAYKVGDSSTPKDGIKYRLTHFSNRCIAGNIEGLYKTKEQMITDWNRRP
jgi:hypothetical protein